MLSDCELRRPVLLAATRSFCFETRTWIGYGFLRNSFKHSVCAVWQGRQGASVDSTSIWLIAGALCGGFINGLSGFGYGLAALPFWLIGSPPVIAAQLAALGSVLGQVQTFSTIRKSVTWRHVGPITVAGLIGIPVGVWLLPMVPVAAFKLGVGLLLISYCIFMLVIAGTWRVQNRRRDVELAAGFAGGITGGVAGIPGPVPVMWGAVQDWPRDDKRALFQIFNLATLVFMLVSTAVAGLMTFEFFKAAALVVPATIAGTFLGNWLYRQVDDNRFDRIVLSILLLSGAALIIGGATS